MRGKKTSNFYMNSLHFTSIGGLRVIYVLGIVWLIVTLVGSNDYKEEIQEEPYQEINADDDMENMIMLSGEDLDESSIFSEDSEYEEIQFGRGEFVEFDSETNLKVESVSHAFSDKAYKRYKDEFFPKSSIKKRRLHKRDTSSCEPTVLSIKCDATAMYRTPDGTCNNLEHPEWGMANGCQERYFPASYNGTSGLRTSVTGGPLPEPRQLSLNISEDKNRPSEVANQLHPMFGQYITHDIVLSATPVTSDGQSIDCCDPELQNSTWCSARINVKKDDPFYKKFGVRCINFGRAASCDSCFNGDRKLLNLVTSYMDCSQVYGSSRSTAMALRANDTTGRLRSQQSDVGELLPNSSFPDQDQCSLPDQGKFCFEAGDVRVNQHTALSCKQTMFMRLHNFIATKLKIINPSWDDEKLYQQTRRIVIAIHQVITFKEYLYILLNGAIRSQYKLDISDDYTTYDPKKNAAIIQMFSAAAFRTPHSMINTRIALRPLNVTQGEQKFSKTYSLPFGLHDGNCSDLFTDLTLIPAQKVDRFDIEGITNYLYRPPGESLGADLSAADIARGRDSGLQNYAVVARNCTGKNITNFSDLSTMGLMSEENVKKLRENYKSFDDVDVKVGMTMESAMKDSLVGPTANCIIAKQFARMKFGDRFWFEHKDQAGSFTKDQLSELKKVTLTMVLCQTAKNIALPMNAMLLPGLNNPLVNCGCVGFLDLSKWKE